MEQRKIARYMLIAIFSIFIAIVMFNMCEREHQGNSNEVLQKQEQKKETIKAKIVIEEKKVTRVKEQKAIIKERLTVVKKGLILEVDSILNDTSKVKQAIDVIEKQGLVISADSGIIALQDTIIGHYKQLDSTNTNIIVELKEDTKKQVKQAKNKAFKKGLIVGIITASVLLITILSRFV